MKNERGFSLIELLVALAIVGVLAFFAYPSYQGMIKDGRRSAVQSYMLEITSRQANYLQDNRNYSDDVNDLNVNASSEVSDNYSITITIGAIGSPPEFTVTASPLASGSMVGEGDMSINHLGVKTPSDQW